MTSEAWRVSVSGTARWTFDWRMVNEEGVGVALPLEAIDQASAREQSVEMQFVVVMNALGALAATDPVGTGGGSSRIPQACSVSWPSPASSIAARPGTRSDLGSANAILDSVGQRMLDEIGPRTHFVQSGRRPGSKPYSVIRSGGIPEPSERSTG